MHGRSSREEIRDAHGKPEHPDHGKDGDDEDEEGKVSAIVYAEHASDRDTASHERKLGPNGGAERTSHSLSGLARA
jgi:hypothetical protein